MSPGSHCWSYYILFLSCHLVNSLQLISLQWRHNWRDGASNHQPHNCLLNRLFRRRSQKTSKLRVTGLCCAGNSPVAGEFPAQMASNAENVSIWWRHHMKIGYPTDVRPSTVLSAAQYIFIISCFIWFQELYNVPYEHIDWSRQRNNISWADLYSPHSWLLDLGYCECNYSYITLASWRLKWLTTRLIEQPGCSGLQQRKRRSPVLLALCEVKPPLTIKTPHFWPFVRGIRWWAADSPHKGPVMPITLPYYDIVIGIFFSCFSLLCTVPSIQ